MGKNDTTAYIPVNFACGDNNDSLTNAIIIKPEKEDMDAFNYVIISKIKRYRGLSWREIDNFFINVFWIYRFDRWNSGSNECGGLDY
jgi:hypothetical protein